MPPREPSTSANSSPSTSRFWKRPQRLRPVVGRLPSGVAAGGTEGRWDVVIDSTGVAVVTDAVTVAEAHVWERDGQVILEFWSDGAEVPGAVGVDLVERAFTHPAVHAHAEVLACVPRRDVTLFEQACRYIENASTRSAGMTNIVEGRIREVAPAAR